MGMDAVSMVTIEIGRPCAKVVVEVMVCQDVKVDVRVKVCVKVAVSVLRVLLPAK